MTPAATRIVVTGTDTDVGKTVFAAALTDAIAAFYWKPIQAGFDAGSDAGTVAALGVSADRILPEAYRLATPCSPHRAAEIDGVAINPDRLVPPRTPGPLVIEGAGGALVPVTRGLPNGSFCSRVPKALVPVTRGLLFADLFARWGFPVVIVARTGLGTINHSLLTIEALRARGVAILGVAFVGDAVEDSEATIAAIGGVRRLGRLPRLAPLTPATLRAAFRASFRREDFA